MAEKTPPANYKILSVLLDGYSVAQNNDLINFLCFLSFD
jgi:hypothetical protein